MTIQETDIVWCDFSANHWVGCAKVSEGCRHCWAAGVANRFNRTPEPWTIDNIDANLEVYDEDQLDLLSRADPGWVFYPSSSDPYLPWLPREALYDYHTHLRTADHLCFQVLTKWGPEEQRANQDALPHEYEPHPDGIRWPDNVILGVSCESPRRTYRIDWLREQSAATKFVSFEPLVEEIESVDLSGIDWMIVGGESHPADRARREMDPRWARKLYLESRRQDVAFLFKQHSGRYAEERTELSFYGSRREYHEFPSVPADVPQAPTEFR